MTEVGQLMEVILYVEDMSAQARFYCDTLGLKVKDPLGAQHLDELCWLELDTGHAHWHSMPTGSVASAPTHPRSSLV